MGTPSKKGIGYPNLQRIPDRATQDTIRILHERLAALETQAGGIGGVTKPLVGALDAAENTLSNVGDPGHELDAVNLRYLTQYVQSYVQAYAKPLGGQGGPPAGVTIPGPAGPGPGDTEQPGPPPNVNPGPSPTVPVVSPVGDAIDLTTVTILNSPLDMAPNWVRTAAITLLDYNINGAHIDFTTKASWPDYTIPGWAGPIEYTLWIFLKIAGVWYGSGIIQFWRALDRSGGPPSLIPNNWYYDAGRWAPMTGYVPAVGESVGFMVSAGNARNNDPGTSLRERSNIVLVPFPGDSGASYVFT